MTLSANKKQTVYERCLTSLLAAMSWHGSEKQIKEVMPHFDELDSIEELCRVMESLNYETNTDFVSYANIDERLFPCLYYVDSGELFVLLSEHNGKVKVLNGETGNEELYDRKSFVDQFCKGTIYKFKENNKQVLRRKQAGWFRDEIYKNKKLILNSLFISFITSLLALAVPLFVIVVYVNVIAVGSYSMLGSFSVGVVIALVGMMLILRLRAKHLSLVGAEIDRNIGISIFSKLLYLPPVYLETATVGAQVARLKDFDRLRELLTTSIMGILFEVPFVFVALVAIYILSGKLALVAIIMMAILLIIAFLSIAYLNRKQVMDVHYAGKTQTFLLEALSKLRVIKYTATKHTWYMRYRHLSALTSLSNFWHAMYKAINLAVSEFLLIISGLTVLAFGALKIMAGELSVGVLIAVMILTWRVLTPFKSLFNNLPRFLEIRRSIKQINVFMSLKNEVDEMDVKQPSESMFHGPIVFYKISMRYPGSSRLALSDVNFKIDFGSLVGIIGSNGAGKSTLLRLILGIYTQQYGVVQIAGQQIGQINTIQLRKSIAYLPQTPQLFFGTIAANLRLASPLADENEMWEALKRAGCYEQIKRLPEGLETKIVDKSKDLIASSLQQGICLARLYLRDASILLLDEPGVSLDADTDKRLMDRLTSLRGKKTVLMITQRPSHLRLMDKVIVMHHGRLVYYGEPEAALSQVLQGGFHE